MKSERKQFLEERKKRLELLESKFLIEGIDIDPFNKTVSFNSSHEHGVDTSILLNPQYSRINNFDVISIFKRKRIPNSDLDGNPLLYALKELKGWKFLNPKKDITNLLKQFIRISEKIKPSYDTIITVPSTNKLNLDFLHRFNKIIKAKHKITDAFFKLSADYVQEDFVNYELIRKLTSEREEEKVLKKLKSYFDKMRLENEGFFSYKFIKEVSYRKFIKRTMYSDEEKLIEYAPFVNNKNILILDDTIGSGSTVSEAVFDIENIYEPKSVTVITLFSKFY